VISPAELLVKSFMLTLVIILLVAKLTNKRATGDFQLARFYIMHLLLKYTSLSPDHVLRRLNASQYLHYYLDLLLNLHKKAIVPLAGLFLQAIRRLALFAGQAYFLE